MPRMRVRPWFFANGFGRVGQGQLEGGLGIELHPFDPFEDWISSTTSPCLLLRVMVPSM